MDIYDYSQKTQDFFMIKEYDLSIYYIKTSQIKIIYVPSKVKELYSALEGYPSDNLRQAYFFC